MAIWLVCRCRKPNVGILSVQTPTFQPDADRCVRVDFEQVKCPAVLTDKTNCSRVDEQLQLASKSTEPISTNVKITLAVCVPFFSTASAVAAYWLFRRRRSSMNRMTKKDITGLTEDLPRTRQLELAASAENADPRTQEFFPVYIQDLDTEHIQKINAVAVHEMEISPGMKVPGSRRWTILKYTKPLPNIPVEIKGSSVCEELEGEYGRPLI